MTALLRPSRGNRDYNDTIIKKYIGLIAIKNTKILFVILLDKDVFIFFRVKFYSNIE